MSEPAKIKWVVALKSGELQTVEAHRLRVSELGVLTALMVVPRKMVSRDDPPKEPSIWEVMAGALRTVPAPPFPEEIPVKLWAPGAWVSAQPAILTRAET